MVLVITYRDKGTRKEIVSHGVDSETGRVVVMSQHSPEECGAVWDVQLQEWVIREDDCART